MNLIHPAFLLFVLFLACRFPTFEQPSDDVSDIPDQAIVFYAIDNEVTVWINDSEVYKYSAILSSTDPKIVVDIKPYLQKGRNKIEVKLKDIPNARCLVNTWAITYDIYSDGKILDYWTEKRPPNDECAEEYKVEKEHFIEL